MIDISFILSLILIISGCSAPKDSNLNKNKKQSIKNQITLNERAYFVKWEEGANQPSKEELQGLDKFIKETSKHGKYHIAIEYYENDQKDTKAMIQREKYAYAVERYIYKKYLKTHDILPLSFKVKKVPQTKDSKPIVINANGVMVVITEYNIASPNCDRKSGFNFDARSYDILNKGCVSNYNLGKMIYDPKDLVLPEKLSNKDPQSNLMDMSTYYGGDE